MGLPRLWHIKLTRENQEIVGGYYDKKCGSRCYSKEYSGVFLGSVNDVGEHITDETPSKDRSGKKELRAAFACRTDGVEITFEQFKEHVLNKKPADTVINSYPIY